MNDTPIAVSDLLPGEAALVDYQKYKEKHPTLPDAREIASRADDARIFILPLSGAAEVEYSKFDLFRFETPAPNGNGEMEEKTEIASAVPEFIKKES